mmetsp:Transcript_7490/g.18714  ORF Transcript_7490/g.18714 Transcript_7490/m.18714 type:complete len:381 (-) Transcript_7490:629-1771(-)
MSSHIQAGAPKSVVAQRVIEAGSSSREFSFEQDAWPWNVFGLPVAPPLREAPPTADALRRRRRAKKVFRQLSKMLHSDKGGDDRAMTFLNEAWRPIERELEDLELTHPDTMLTTEDWLKLTDSLLGRAGKKMWAEMEGTVRVWNHVRALAETVVTRRKRGNQVKVVREHFKQKLTEQSEQLREQHQVKLRENDQRAKSSVWKMICQVFGFSSRPEKSMRRVLEEAKKNMEDAVEGKCKLEEGSRKMQDTLSGLTQEKRKLEMKVQELESDKKKLVGTIEDLEQETEVEKQSLQKRVQELEGDKDKLEMSVEELKGDKQELQKSVQQLQDNIQELQMRMQKSESEKQMLENRKQELQDNMVQEPGDEIQKLEKGVAGAAGQ